MVGAVSDVTHQPTGLTVIEFGKGPVTEDSFCVERVLDGPNLTPGEPQVLFAFQPTLEDALRLRLPDGQRNYADLHQHANAEPGGD